MCWHQLIWPHLRRSKIFIHQMTFHLDRRTGCSYDMGSYISAAVIGISILLFGHCGSELWSRELPTGMHHHAKPWSRKMSPMWFLRLLFSDCSEYIAVCLFTQSRLPVGNLLCSRSLWFRRNHWYLNSAAKAILPEFKPSSNLAKLQ